MAKRSERATRAGSVGLVAAILLLVAAILLLAARPDSLQIRKASLWSTSVSGDSGSHVIATPTDGSGVTTQTPPAAPPTPRASTPALAPVTPPPPSPSLPQPHHETPAPVNVVTGRVEASDCKQQAETEVVTQAELQPLAAIAQPWSTIAFDVSRREAARAVLQQAKQLRALAADSPKRQAAAAQALTAALALLPPAPPPAEAVAAAIPAAARALLPAAVQLVAVMRAQGASVQCWHDPTLPVANETWWAVPPAARRDAPDAPWPRVLLAANQRNSEYLLPFWSLELLRTAAMLQYGHATRSGQPGSDSPSVGVSIYESGSSDSTPMWLDVLTTLLDILRIPRVIVANGRLKRFDRQHRIAFLAGVRNRLLDQALLAPMPRRGRGGGGDEYEGVDYRPERLLFINDVYACATDMLRLVQLDSKLGSDMTCGMDFFRPGDDFRRLSRRSRSLLEQPTQEELEASRRREEARQVEHVRAALRRDLAEQAMPVVSAANSTAAAARPAEGAAAMQSPAAGERSPPSGAVGNDTVVPQAAAENGTVVLQAALGNGTVAPQAAAANGTAEPKVAAGNGTVAPKAAAANGTVQPQAAAAAGNGTAEPKAAAANGTVVSQAAAANGTVEPQAAAGNGTAEPKAAAANGTVVSQAAAANGTVEPQAAAGNGTVVLQAAVGNGTVAPQAAAANGTVEPQAAAANGTAEPKAAAANGTVVSQAAAANGTVVPQAAVGNGTVAPQAAAANGTVEPQAAAGNGTAEPKAAAANGTVVSQAAKANGTVEPQAAAGNGTAEPKAAAANGTVVSQAAAANGTVEPQAAAGNGTAEPKAAAANGTVVSQAAAAIGTVEPQAAAGNGTVVLQAAVGNGTVAPQAAAANGTVEPQAAAGNGTAEPKAAAANGTVVSQAAAANGTVVPQAAVGNGTVAPQAAAANGTVEPQAAAANGTAEPKAAAANGTVVSQAAAANGTVVPQAAVGNGTVAPQAAAANGTVEPQAAATNGTVVSQAAAANGTVVPQAAVGNGTVAPKAAAANGTVEPQAAAANGTVAPQAAAGNGTAEPQAAVGNGTAEPQAAAVNQSAPVVAGSAADAQPSQPAAEAPAPPAPAVQSLSVAVDELMTVLAAQRAAREGQRWLSKRQYYIYDVWVMRDVLGEKMANKPPVIPSHGPSALRLAMGLPVAAFCCWNGAAVINAAPFLPPPSSNTVQRPAARNLQAAPGSSSSGKGSSGKGSSGKSSGSKSTSKGSSTPTSSPPASKSPLTTTTAPQQNATGAAAAYGGTRVDGAKAAAVADARSGGYPQLRFRHGLVPAGECDASECGLICDDLHRLGYNKIIIDPTVRLPYLPANYHGLHHEWFWGAPHVKWAELATQADPPRRAGESHRALKKGLAAQWEAAKRIGVKPPDIDKLNDIPLDPGLACGMASNRTGNATAQNSNSASAKPFAALTACLHKEWGALAARVRTPAPEAASTAQPGTVAGGGFGPPLSPHMQVACMNLIKGTDKATNKAFYVNLNPFNFTAIYLAHRTAPSVPVEADPPMGGRCPPMPGYNLTLDQTQAGADVAQVGDPLYAALFCNADPACAAFTSDGWLRKEGELKAAKGSCAWVKQGGMENV
ncbi:hypothetical protein HYH03_018759 [Edaphochlamys debaryana]|uniref:Uncharacterized protein n=1 Tax=Edaphochlamys debaryana TaxID=47281 RepID=A0A835XFY7_9CHLO|nr:hypothetical protein HYH03_018759 [Edaphochlamys debaryana]|eukprot:KAG2482317.1 hypothetical protein HYH03_018759 [Edaphochlamys debaryana]